MTTGPEVRLGAWLQSLASRTSAPGGGAAAAVGVAMAAALAAMAARFSSAVIPDADELARAADDVRDRALLLAAADEEAVGAIYDQERGETPETKRRGRPSPEAALRAAEIPLRIVELAAELRPGLVRLLRDGNPRLSGDAGVGLGLLDGSASSAAVLVRIDVADLGDQERGRLLRALSAAEAMLGAPG